MVIEKGKLVRWIDDKGFGFIKPESGKNDIFIHISALRGMSRKPVIGDVKVWCSQMSSYEEAVFYLRNCPGTKMDGDGDGDPCERQFE
jgi:cold shock CspA family protein